MSRRTFDFFGSLNLSSKQCNSIRNSKQGQDLGSIYSFKKDPKLRTRKITPVSKKTSPLPRCRVQADSGPCWSVQEESEETLIEESEEEKDKTDIIFRFDDDYSINSPEDDVANLSSQDLLFSRCCGHQTELRPASFSEYTERALQMRIEHEMERFLSIDEPSKCSQPGGDVSPLFRRTVVCNTLNVRKTTVDSGYNEDLDYEDKLEESDIDSTSFDLGSSDEEHPLPPTRSSSCNGGYQCYDKGSTRRRKITPIPRTRGPSRQHFGRKKDKNGDKSCISLEEEDYEDVENFNSDDDFVDMGMGSKQSSKSISRTEEINHTLSPVTDESTESRLRSYSSGSRENSYELKEKYLRPEARKRKRAVTLIPSLGELEKCRGGRKDGYPTPESKPGDTPVRRSSSSTIDDGTNVTISFNTVSNSTCPDQTPSIKVQDEDDLEQNEKEEAEDQSKEHNNDLDSKKEMDALGENYCTSPKGATRRKLTPADIGHPCLGKMKELREQMVGLHLEEDDEGGEHKSHSTLDS